MPKDLGRIFGSIRKLVSTKYHVLSLRHGGKRAGIDAEVTRKGKKGKGRIPPMNDLNWLVPRLEYAAQFNSSPNFDYAGEMSAISS